MHSLTRWLEEFAVAIDLKRQHRRLGWLFLLMAMSFLVVFVYFEVRHMIAFWETRHHAPSAAPR